MAERRSKGLGGTAWGVLALGALLAGCPAAPATTPYREPPPVAGRVLAAFDPLPFSLLPAATVPEPPAEPPASAAFGRGGDDALDPARSWSIGSTAKGYLVGARRLPDDGPHLRPRPVSVERDAVYGTETLVGLLERAAGRVAARWPGTILWAGDLSAERGGPIPGHASHRSGRDADLAFFFRDAAGAEAHAPDLPRVGADGRTLDGHLSFDAERTWALVDALLTDPHVQLQWIFVAGHLEDLLLSAGARARAPDALLARAAEVLKQPRDSSSHDDHFHLRIYCGLEERVEGCADAPPWHPWVDDHAAELRRRVAEVLPFLATGAPDEVRYAVTRLVRLRAPEALPSLDRLSASPDPEVSSLARDAAAFLRGEAGRPEWALFRAEDVWE